MMMPTFALPATFALPMTGVLPMTGALTRRLVELAAAACFFFVAMALRLSDPRGKVAIIGTDVWLASRRQIDLNAALTELCA